MNCSAGDPTSQRPTARLCDRAPAFTAVMAGLGILLSEPAISLATKLPFGKLTMASIGMVSAQALTVACAMDRLLNFDLMG